ncbi:hypothetical protein BUALT_Bualt04G0024000 [Buddleja alternifolia]|uniref:Reverse transcriptase domain-containing protein n=1 Tax=Buddleja alternifolia TaxID=168488 RepID=A0AAV6XT96_9LAMI|nr:hypothetical protein BUALT_Bualt04G0024000 [Buddleja alternifolia]
MSTTSFSILVNGSPFGLINPSWGIRQGDPLSPYLFIIYFELLSRMLTRLENLTLINGVKVSRTSPTFTHLMYADDLVIYCQANVSNADSVHKCLNFFEDWSGLSVSKSKSVIHFSHNVSPELKNEIKNLLDIKECCHKIQHLGLPFCKQQKRTACFNDLVEKLNNKLSGWKAKNLSQAGRLILLKTVAQAIPVYQMSHYLLPISICSKLDASMRKFSWGHDPNKNHLHLMAWDDICRPKALGGLGLRKMKDLNFALLSKLAWKMVSEKNCIWLNLFRYKYLKSSNMLHSVSTGTNASWIWKDILRSKDLLSKGACYSVHVNSKILTWLEPWIPSFEGFIPPPPLSSRGCVIFAEVGSLINNVTNSWDLEVLNSLFAPHLVKCILKIQISLSSDPHKLFWTPSVTGKFSVKSSFSILSHLASLSHNRNRTPLFKKIWAAHLHERHKLFAWKVACNILLIRHRLMHILNVEHPRCPFCDDHVETLEHIFINCPFAKRVWWLSKWGFKTDNFHDFSIHQWLVFIFEKKWCIDITRAEEFLISAICIMDSLWKARNLIFHNHPRPIESKIAALADKVALEHSEAQAIVSLRARHVCCSADWSPLAPGSFKINTDVAFVEGRGACSMLIRNFEGTILFAASQRIWAHDASQAESEGIRFAVIWADSLQIDKSIFESDSEFAIRNILGPLDSSDWQPRVSIQDIHRVRQRWPFWKFNFMRHQANSTTHALAQWAFHSNWDGPFLFSHLKFISANCLSVPHPIRELED